MINTAGLIVTAANMLRELEEEEQTPTNEEKHGDYEPFDDYKPTSRFEKIKDKVFWSFAWISILSCVFAMFYLVYNITPVAQHKDAKKQGVKQILNSAHSDAINSAYTINLADYEIASKLKAKCDSLYYAKRISHFIHFNGNKFVKPKPIIQEVYGRRYVVGYDSEIDQNRIRKDPKFNNLLTNYKKSVQQLAVLRRINNQR